MIECSRQTDIEVYEGRSISLYPNYMYEGIKLES